MKTRNAIALLGIGLLLAACIPSVNPFYTAKDLVFEERLLGEWQEKDKPQEPQIWKFEKGEDKGYKLQVTEKGGKQGQFDAHLFKLKEDLFLDLIPTECNYATNEADLVAASMIPGHLLAHLSQVEPELKIAFTDFDWLQKQLTNNPSILPHRREGDSFVLTASTRELQKFVLKHLGEGELFGKPGEMVRRTDSK
jgi:hypothetical protein